MFNPVVASVVIPPNAVIEQIGGLTEAFCICAQGI
jgi:hypothetical protein